MSESMLCTFARSAVVTNEPAPFLGTVSKSNKVKIWKTSSNSLQQTLTEPQHLAQIYTCLDIFITSAASSKARTENSAGIQSSSGLVVVGTNQGMVNVWDLQTGSVVHRFGYDGDSGHNCKVTSVVVCNNGRTVFSGSEDGAILEWDLQTGRFVRSLTDLFSAPVTKLAASSDDSFLLAASSSIKVISMSSMDVIAEYTGVVGSVSVLKLNPDNNMLLVSCEAERYITVWPVTNKDDEQPKKRKRVTNAAKKIFVHTVPLASITFDGTVTDASFYTNNDGKVLVAVASSLSSVGVFDLSASLQEYVTTNVIAKNTITLNQPVCFIDGQISVNGGASVVNKSGFDITKSSKQGINTNTTTNNAIDGEGNVACINFLSEKALFIARYSTVHPQTLQIVIVNESNGHFIPSLTLPPFETQHMKPIDSGKQTNDKMKSEKLAQVNTLSTTVVTVADHSLGKVTNNLDKDVILSTGNALQAANSLHEQRLQLLATAGDLTKALAERIVENQKLISRSNTGANVSLYSILTQALHTDDDKMLEECLFLGEQRRNRHGRTNMIQVTIAKLAPALVIPLVSRLVTKLQSNPNRGLSIIPWIRTALRLHATHLISTPNLAHQLSALYKITEQRLQSQKKLLTIQGRLDLILSQVNRVPEGFLELNKLEPTQYQESDNEEENDNEVDADIYDDEDDEMFDDDDDFEDDI